MLRIKLWSLHIKYLYTMKLKSINGKTIASKLLISYFLIILICTVGIGILSERFVTGSITDNTIKSNNELLSQFKNTIDNYVLGSIDKISLLIFQDILTDLDIAYYFSYSIDGNMSGIMKVSKYLDSVKMANPLISTISVYYRKSNLLISTEGVRYLSSEYRPDQKLIDSINRLNNTKSSLWVSTNQIPFQVNKYRPYRNELLFNRKAPASAGEGGFILVSINEDVLSDIIETSSPIDFGQIFVINEEGTIISHNNKEYLYTDISRNDYGRKVLENTGNSNYFISQVNGIESVIAVSASDYNGWKYISIKSIDKISEKYSFLSKIILIISSLFFAFAAFVSVISASKVYSPIKRLTNSCREIIKKASSEIQGSEYEIIGSTISILTDKLDEQESKLSASYSVLKHHFITGLVSSNAEVNDMRDRAEMLKISLPFKYYFVIAINLGKIPIDMELKAFEVAKLDIINYTESGCSGDKIKCICTENNGELIAVFNNSLDYIDFDKIAADIWKYIHNLLNIRPYIGMGRVVSDVKGLSNSFTDAQKCIKYSYFYPNNYIIRDSDILHWELNNDKLPAQFIEEFRSSLNANRKAPALETIKKALFTIHDKQLSYSTAVKFVSKIVSSLDGFMEQMGINIFKSGEDDIYSQFNSITNIRDFEIWLEKIIDQVLLCVEDKRSHRNNDVVDKVKILIGKYYESSDFSLNFAANNLFISPNYLSRIFKEETGTNFIDYLADFRLEKAKLLLLSSDMKIEEVSAKAGYSSPQYFIKKFKEKYSLTPREYRCKEVI